jgi:hypothetical protein
LGANGYQTRQPFMHPAMPYRDYMDQFPCIRRLPEKSHGSMQDRYREAVGLSNPGSLIYLEVPGSPALQTPPAAALVAVLVRAQQRLVPRVHLQ